MSNVEEMLNTQLMVMPNIASIITIEPETRRVIVPEAEMLFGVESDKDSERKYFKCPKIIGDNIDLTMLHIRINFTNANGEYDEYIVEDVQVVDEEYVMFSWVLSEKVTRYRGNVRFIVCAASSNEGTLINEWNTTPAVGLVLEGLEATNPEYKGQSDAILQLLQMFNSAAASAKGVSARVERVTGGVKIILSDNDKTTEAILNDGEPFKYSDFTQAQINALKVSAIKDVVTQWYISTSKDALADGNWLAMRPTWVAERFLWKRDVITYVDGTVVQTIPVRDASWDDIGSRFSLTGGITITGGTDLNNITTPGNYICPSDTIAASLKNSPLVVGFTMKVFLSTGINYPAQELRHYRKGTKYFRLLNSITNEGIPDWSAWSQVYDQNSKPTLEELGVAAITNALAKRVKVLEELAGVAVVLANNEQGGESDENE